MRIREAFGIRILLIAPAVSTIAIMPRRVLGAAPGQPHQSAPPEAPKGGPSQGVTPVNVLIKNTCDHEVHPSSAKLHTTTKDLLRWQIQNNCGQDQPVLICVYDKTTNLLKNPFERCRPDPNVHDVGRIFTVTAHGHATFDCATENPHFHGKYRKQVRVGPREVPAAGCPAVFQRHAPPPPPGTKSPVKVLMHALDVDVLP